jgi:exo-beta-1,3-glucanase (GH17 family)
MSGYRNKIHSLTGIEAGDKSYEELLQLFHELMKKKMHGLCFSPYLEGQQPGTELSEEQVRRRLEIIRPHTNWVRSFSCTEGNEHIPRIARQMGMKTLVGAWIGKDEEINEKEIQNLIMLSNEGFVDVAAVGNEVMYRGDRTEAQLLDYIKRVKEQVADVPVGYVDAYYEFEAHPAITDACDVILANCYPFWEGCMLDYSLVYMKDMYRRAMQAANGKKVIITETGWPNKGNTFYGAVPSDKNALVYLVNSLMWSLEDDIELFYFSSFDESWKVDAEGDLGAFWGIWDKNEQLKY